MLETTEASKTQTAHVYLQNKSTGLVTVQSRATTNNNLLI